MRDLNRFQGCLIGGAAGDALGYPVEFMPLEAIQDRYGPRGITSYELRNGKAFISDDTQMTMFTAAGLMTASTQKHLKAVTPQDVEGIRQSYLDWYHTQTKHYNSGYKGRSWLAQIPELYSRRAPGNTCLSAMSQGGKGELNRPLNSSAGCGGVMRVAPVGLFFSDQSMGMAQVDKLAAKAAALTHGSPLAWLPAAALAHIIQCIAEGGMSVADAVEESIVVLPLLFPKCPEMEYMTSILEAAIALADSEYTDSDSIAQLGEGWVGHEALAIAAFCALRYPDDIEGALIAAVNHSGDTDSTGAICGNIVGAAVGYNAIPEKFTDDLELRDELLQLAQDMWIDESARDQGWFERYTRPEGER